MKAWYLFLEVAESSQLRFPSGKFLNKMVDVRPRIPNQAANFAAMNN